MTTSNDVKFGQSLKFTTDLEINASGVLKTVTQEENALQSIKIALETQVGENFFDVTIGFDLLAFFENQGHLNEAEQEKYLALLLSQTCLLDDRVFSVVSIEFDRNNETRVVDVIIKLQLFNNEIVVFNTQVGVTN